MLRRDILPGQALPIHMFTQNQAELVKSRYWFLQNYDQAGRAKPGLKSWPHNPLKQ